MSKPVAISENIMRASAPAARYLVYSLGFVFSGFVMFMILDRSVLLAGALLLVLACLILMLRWPEVGTLVVLFAIYSNISVLAMRMPGEVQQSAGSVDQNPRVAIVLAGLCLLLCVPLLEQLFIRKQKLIFDRVFFLMLVFLAASLASSIFARDGHVVLLEIGNYLFEGIALYFLLTNLVRDLPMLKRAVWALLFAGTLMAGLTVLQHFTRTTKETYGGLAQVESDFKTNPRLPKVETHPAAKRVAENGEVQGLVRAAGPIGETNRYGQILLVLLPLALLLAKIEESRKSRMLAVAAGAVILGGLLLTYSRGNILGLVCVFVLMACVGFLTRRQFIGAIVAVCLFIGLFGQGILTRMATLDRVNALLFRARVGEVSPDGSAIRRYVENVAAWRVFMDHPILGVGPGHFAPYYSNDYGNRVGLIEQTRGYRAHNLYFELLAERGVIGFVCFMAIFWTLGLGLWRIRKRLIRIRPVLADTAAAFFFSLTAYAVSAIFAHLSYQRYFWILIALCAAALRIIHTEADSQETECVLERCA